jgi:uncharacterized membrane protein
MDAFPMHSTYVDNLEYGSAYLPFMSKPFTVQHAETLSIATLVIGVVIFTVGLLDLLNVRFAEVGTWGYWLVGIGAVLLLIGLIWLITYRLNVKKFNKMMEEKSKANFVRKIDDVEYLAWRLPLKFEERLSAKKKELGIK